MQPVHKSTPWGFADWHENHGQGIDFYSTPSHGGFHLSEQANEKVPAAFRKENRWYEEDCEWCAVAFAFPALFNREEQEAAHKTAQFYYPKAYAATFPAAA